MTVIMTTITISLPPDIIELLNKYGRDGGNKSGLIASLLRGYFRGDIQRGGTDARVAMIAAQYEELTAEIRRLGAMLEHEISRRKEEELEAEKRKEEFKQKIREWFNVERFGSEDGWIADQNRDGPDTAQRAVQRGIATLAEKSGFSLPGAVQVLNEVYPKLAALAALLN